jgi:hypothetical protein
MRSSMARIVSGSLSNAPGAPSRKDGERSDGAFAPDRTKRWGNDGVKTGLQLGLKVVSPYNVAHHALDLIIDSPTMPPSIAITSVMMPGAITDK